MPNVLLDKFRRMNWPMLLSMLGLIVMGSLFIWSSGSARSSETLRNLWKVHIGTALAGLVLYAVFALTDYRKILDWAALPSFVVSCVLLVLVLFIGSERYGGRRWLWFFQPSEVAKLAVILFSVHVFGRPGRESFKWFLIGLAILTGPALLILAEPDLGTALALVPAVFTLLLAARVWTRGVVTLLLTGLLAAGLTLGTVYVAENEPLPEKRERIYRYMPFKAHQIKRLRVFLFPDRDVQGDGYNLNQAKIAIGSGSMWGQGLKRGRMMRLGYLPPKVAMNDFIFAVVAEEAGFMGCVGMLLLFLGILLPGLRIAFSATDDRGRLLAIGILTLIFCHVYINVAMNVGLMPITGLPLPFISAGRTFLVVVLAALGIVQSVGIHRDDGR
ncbi:MAG: FtsW/RodA/SpoVE family cell cycle protein [Kiritimatiellia bacterium]